ncbi:hypothetical protein MsAg5_05230 [Methanosarcinaceae archaeon Ag5]|uniref:S-layer family duplication domain-containing protein n=1 Tax=Methanolapillus africanus TaxID=3028297 RepID=A0AAE4MK81_9EURY|nr:hypothetical protein [Methanosarcinaceae archaeon Ag5]
MSSHAKIDQNRNSRGLSLFSISAVLLFLSFLLLLTPVSADAVGEENVSIRDNVGEYTHRDLIKSENYFLLREGEIEKFDEGYELHLAGSGSGDKILVELHNTADSDPKYITSVVMNDGDYLYCSRLLNGEYYLVLSFQLDKSYVNSSGIVSGFSSFNQYEDPYVGNSSKNDWYVKVTDSPEPVLPDGPKPGGNQTVNSSGFRVSEISSMMLLILASAATAVIIAALLIKKVYDK